MKGKVKKVNNALTLAHIQLMDPVTQQKGGQKHTQVKKRNKKYGHKTN